MKEDKFEHKNELDCEVTVFEGAHSTCDKTENNSDQKQETQKEESAKEIRIKDDYYI